MENIRHVLMVRVLHVLKFCSWSCSPHKSPCGSRVSRFLLITPFPGIWTLSIFLSPHLRTFGSGVCAVRHKSPYASMITLSFIVVTRIDRMCQVLRKFYLRAPRAALHQVDRCRLHWNRGSWLCRRKSLLDLFLTWRSAFQSDQKEISEMAAREHPETHHVEQTKQMIPLVTKKTPYGWNISKLVLGVNIFDLDLGFQFNFVEQPIKRNSVGSGHVSYCWTSSFKNPLDDSFVVFKIVRLRRTLRRMCLGGYVIHFWQLPIVCHMPESILWLPSQVSWPTTECLVFQFVPSTSISIQFVSKLVTNLQLIHVLPAWLDGHPGKDLKLWKTAPQSCLPARSMVQRIFEQVPPCRRTTLLFLREAFSAPVIFQLLEEKYVIQTSLYFLQW